MCSWGRIYLQQPKLFDDDDNTYKDVVDMLLEFISLPPLIYLSHPHHYLLWSFLFYIVNNVKSSLVYVGVSHPLQGNEREEGNANFQVI